MADIYCLSRLIAFLILYFVLIISWSSISAYCCIESFVTRRTEKSPSDYNFINRNQIVYTILIQNQMEFRLVPSKSENGKYLQSDFVSQESVVDQITSDQYPGDLIRRYFESLHLIILMYGCCKGFKSVKFRDSIWAKWWR